MIRIRSDDYKSMVAYAKKELPNEACGMIAGIMADGDKVIKKVYCLTNLDHSGKHFSLDPKEQFEAIRDMRANGLKLLGNWHSHPQTPSMPSQEDIRLAYDGSASYLILSLMEAEPALCAFHINGDLADKEELQIESS